VTTFPDLAAWHEANDAYLAAAVEWLRLLLTRHVPTTTQPMVIANEQRATPRTAPASTQSAPGDESQNPPWWRFRRTSTTGASSPPPRSATPTSRPEQKALPPSSYEVSQEEVDSARARLEEAEAGDPPPAMTILAHRLGLSPFERDLLLLCVAMELDTRIGAFCARAQDDPSLPFPTFGLAFTLFEAPGWDARSPEHPLRFWRLIEINQPWAQPLTSSALRADERIVNYVKGLSHLDDRIAPFVAPFGEDVHEELPPSQAVVVEDILHALDRDQPLLLPIQLLGRDSESKQVVALAAAHRLGLTAYRMPADLLPAQPADLETLARLWQRETLLLPVALYLDAYDVDRAAEAHATPLRRFLARTGGVMFVDAREAWPVPRGSHSFDVEKPLPAEQRGLWQAALGAGHEREATELAAQFNVAAASITRIASEAVEEGDQTPLRRRLWSRAGTHTRLRIDALAQRIDTKATWDDIVLPAPEAALLRQIAAHVGGRGTVYDDWGFRERMNRGFGISALFSGESGTGKTMAAEVIANELDLSLHRIDLSSVVSKWVGETEKNLQQLFNAADDSNGILFFDEADALFGKRTEVQQSQDRFANIEINFLLQRLESYRGLAILATNMKSALDTAFLRRLRFIVSFPFPGPDERRELWRRAFPPKTPTEDLDVERLAKLPFPGGSVHNVALSAAFIAAQRGTSVTMPIVLEAAKTELRKLEKPVHEADFRWSEKVVELVR
jgi:hypothetical protein